MAKGAPENLKSKRVALRETQAERIEKLLLAQDKNLRKREAKRIVQNLSAGKKAELEAEAKAARKLASKELVQRLNAGERAAVDAEAKATSEAVQKFRQNPNAVQEAVNRMRLQDAVQALRQNPNAAQEAVNRGAAQDALQVLRQNPNAAQEAAIRMGGAEDAVRRYRENRERARNAATLRNVERAIERMSPTNEVDRSKSVAAAEVYNRNETMLQKALRPTPASAVEGIDRSKGVAAAEKYFEEKGIPKTGGAESTTATTGTAGGTGSTTATTGTAGGARPTIAATRNFLSKIPSPGKGNALISAGLAAADLISDPDLDRVPKVALETALGMLGATAGGSVGGSVGGFGGFMGGRYAGGKIAEATKAAGENFGDWLADKLNYIKYTNAPEYVPVPRTKRATVEPKPSEETGIPGLEEVLQREPVQGPPAAQATGIPSEPTAMEDTSSVGEEAGVDYMGNPPAATPVSAPAATTPVPTYPNTAANRYLDRIEKLRANRAAAIKANPKLASIPSVIDNTSVVAPERPVKVSPWFQANLNSFSRMTDTLGDGTSAGDAESNLADEMRRQSIANRRAFIAQTGSSRGAPNILTRPQSKAMAAAQSRKFDAAKMNAEELQAEIASLREILDTINKSNKS